jgi:hypothetical protein
LPAGRHGRSFKVIGPLAQVQFVGFSPAPRPDPERTSARLRVRTRRLSRAERFNLL